METLIKITSEVSESISHHEKTKDKKIKLFSINKQPWKRFVQTNWY